jgi:hypothetical protein
MLFKGLIAGVLLDKMMRYLRRLNCLLAQVQRFNVRIVFAAIVYNLIHIRTIYASR